MDASSALADLTEISGHVQTAVVFAGAGSVLASTSASEERSHRLARAALDLLEEAAGVQAGGERRPTELEVALREGSVFVVRDDVRGVVATVSTGAPAGLVLYDLKSCLRAIDEPAKAQSGRASRKKTTADA
jgi:predicted regulator of Ras-like GTPase activity (Roadblock/LC7/MglB family)